MEEINPNPLSYIVSVAHSNLAPDFRKIQDQIPPTLDQGFGRTYCAKMSLVCESAGSVSGRPSGVPNAAVYDPRPLESV